MSISSGKTKSELAADAIAAFATQLQGQLILPSDAGYEDARKVYNGMIDKRPALIARCKDLSDVIHAVNFGRDHQLTVAIRGGGHNGPGLGICEDGLVIDLSLMRGVQVDPSNGTTRAEGGCLWRDVDLATHEFGLAVPSGVIPSTGVGGLTLGGGTGYLSRHYGLTIDNLLEVEMVLADGSCVTANRHENTDLFWAVRGGGGNFGVVTSFLFKANPVHTVYGGPMFWQLEDSADLLRFWQDFILSAPEDINGWFAFATVPPVAPFPEQYHLQKMCGVVWCYTGDLAEAEAAFKPIRKFATPAIDFAGPLPFPALQGMFEPLYPAGMQWYWRADFFNHYDDKAIELHVKHGSELPSMFSTMHIYPINGAVQRVSNSETAWGYRDANFAQVIVGVDPDPNNNERLRTWTKDYWEGLHSFSAGGGYVNMIMDEGEERVKAAYRDNYMHLAQIKAKYDPNNFFHVNQNIKPAN
jgi:UDP-N-acetylenolpyruvoylglucosamine reductase